MALRIPQNQIVESKYTSGGEYLFLDTHKEYKGYYYEFNNKIFAGKEFKADAPEIIKRTSNKVNPLLLNSATYLYGMLSKVKLNSNPPPSSYQFNQDNRNVLRYFIKKANENIIKETNEDNFNQIQNDSIYTSVSLYFSNSGFDQNELNKAEEKMPGIKEYVSTTYVPGVTD